MTTLAALPLHCDAAIAQLALEEREATWLRAVGLAEGTVVTVLRKAAFGGPLHVRISGGAELAVDRELAARVAVDTQPMKASL